MHSERGSVDRFSSTECEVYLSDKTAESAVFSLNTPLGYLIFPDTP